MRFEIRTAGFIGILLVTGLLSGAVFVMGLLAGDDIGHQSAVATQQFATDYPLQAPPAASPPAVAVAATTPVAAAMSAPASTAAAAVRPAVKKAMASADKATDETGLGDEQNDRAAQNDSATDDSDDSAVTDRVAPPPSPAAKPVIASAPTPAPHDLRHKPFNIQIQAAMDSTSAIQMVKRLRALGYQPHMVPTTINGEPWYKVEVGPYVTQADAAAAEASLRQKYNTTYGNGGVPAQSRSANEEQDE